MALRTSTANDLTARLGKRLETERREIEELTANELERLGENSRRVARRALRSIERDTAEAVGKMRELLVKAWLRPLIVGMALWLGIFVGSWATMRWLSRSVQDRIEDIELANIEIEGGREMIAEIEETTWGVGLREVERRAVRDAAARHAGPDGLHRGRAALRRAVERE